MYVALLKLNFIFLFINLFIFTPSFFLDCLVQSAWCDNVKYSENRIDSNEYINNCIPKSWQPFFKRLKKIYYDDTDISLLGNLADNLMDIGKKLDNAIEPQMPLLFKALELVDPEDVKVSKRVVNCGKKFHYPGILFRRVRRCMLLYSN